MCSYLCKDCSNHASIYHANGSWFLEREYVRFHMEGISFSIICLFWDEKRWNLLASWMVVKIWEWRKKLKFSRFINLFEHREKTIPRISPRSPSSKASVLPFCAVQRMMRIATGCSSSSSHLQMTRSCSSLGLRSKETFDRQCALVNWRAINDDEIIESKWNRNIVCLSLNIHKNYIRRLQALRNEKPWRIGLPAERNSLAFTHNHHRFEYTTYVHSFMDIQVHSDWHKRSAKISRRHPTILILSISHAYLSIPVDQKRQ